MADLTKTLEGWKVGEMGFVEFLAEGHCPVPEHAPLELRDCEGQDFGWCDACDVGWRLEGKQLRIYGSPMSYFNAPTVFTVADDRHGAGDE